MENTENTASSQAEARQRSAHLVRPVQGRMLGGVAKGLADHFGTIPWIPRVLFLITAFMGGLGIALYAAGWAFIRSEDETESPADRWFTGAGTRSWVGIVLIVLAAVIVLDSVTILSGEVIWASALLVVGLLLYMGYLPPRGEATAAEETSEPGPPASKEGVQQMTTATTTITSETKAGDSPVGGQAPPPAPPAPTPPELPPAPPREKSILGRLTLGVMVLGMGALAVLDNLAALPIDAEPRHYLALAVTILGLGLLVGSVLGRARWLILLGALLIPTLLFSPAFEYDWNEETFDLTVVPTTFQELEDSYSLDVGSLFIDLRQLDWNGEIVDLTAVVDVGNLTILVPAGVGIQGEARVDVGRVSGPDNQSFGFGDPTVFFDTESTTGTLMLDAEVNAGNIDIDYR